MKMVSVPCVPQFCSTQAVNWPVWRMMNRAGVRIFQGVPPRTRLECGGYEPTAVFDGTGYIMIHWEYSQQYGFISLSWYILWLCLKMGPVCPSGQYKLKLINGFMGNYPIAYNTIKDRMIWELCGTHEKHRSRLSSSLDLVPTTIPRVEGKHQQQDVFVFVIVCIFQDIWTTNL